MPIYFKARHGSSGEWRVLNSMQASMDGRGAIVDGVDNAVLVKARTGSTWSDGQVVLEITHASFREIAQAMLDANPKAAMDAFGAALIVGPREPVFDEDGRELG